MPTNKVRYALFLLLVVLLTIAVPRAVAGNDSKNILYLNSYHDGYIWSEGIYAGIRGILMSSDLKLNLQHEYLDSRRFNYSDIAPLLYALFWKKFHDKKIDLIITSDNPALHFMLEYGPELFPSVPVVFCGYNAPPGTIFPGMEITGIIENLDFSANIRLARNLQPDLNRMIIINGPSSTGNAVYKYMESILPEFSNLLTFETWSDYSMQELVEHVSHQDPRTTAFYFFPVSMDVEGRFYSAVEILDVLHKVSKAQFYSNWNFLLGHGIIGGKITTGHAHGEAAAKMALRVLNGEAASSIPIESYLQVGYMFDYNEITHHDIDVSLLPKGSSFINMPAAFYSVSKNIVWLLSAVLAAFIACLAFMLFKTINRRRIETRGKEQLTFLRLLMDTVPVPIYSEDIFGRISECNVAFEKFFSLTREQILNRSDSDCPPGLKELGKTGRKIATTQGRMGSGELSIIDGKGREHTAVLHHTTYVQPNGEPRGFVGAIIDYTDREKAARDLAASQVMLKLVLDNIPQLVYWKDLNHDFLGANRAFAEFFKINRDKLIGTSTRDFFMTLIEPGRVQDILTMDQNIMTPGKPVRNFRIRSRIRGNTFILDSNRIPLLDPEGNAVGVLITADDISDRLMLQQQLIQSQKMEAIGTLAGGIAHDFNNILTSIINSIELVLDDLNSGSASYVDLSRALRAANQGSRLVRQILSFSRSSVEGFVSTDIKEAINDALYLMKASLPRNIQLWKNITGLPTFMQADPIQIHQVVLNLCTNSSHALKESGGVVEVSLAHTRVTHQQAIDMEIDEGEYALLSITDNGPGIPPENIGKIFVPFFTTKAKGEGTGLGLPVVHGIVKAHRGAIQVFSIPWQKTVFNVYLPLDPNVAAHAGNEREDEKMVGSAAMVESALQKSRILFVEDDESQLYIVPKAMQGLGYTVSAFMSGEDAIKEICANPENIAALVSDFDMPRMNGLDLARAVSKYAPDLPIILISGRGIAADKAAACPNIKEIIQKPYNRDILDLAIRRVTAKI